MNLRSLIPIGRERNLARREANPLATLQTEIDRLFNEFTRGWPSLGAAELLPTMDVTETDGEIKVMAELPGLEEKDIEISVADNVLTVRGEKKAEKEEKDVGLGLKLPLYLSGRDSVGWWAMLITMLGVFSAFVALVFGYFFYWTLDDRFLRDAAASRLGGWPLAGGAMVLA